MALFNDEQSDGLISIPFIRLFLLLVNDKLSSVNRPLTFLPVKIVNFSKLAKFFLVENPDSQFESCKLCGSETITSRAQTTETSASTNKQESSIARVTPFKFNKHV